MGTESRSGFPGERKPEGEKLVPGLVEVNGDGFSPSGTDQPLAKITLSSDKALYGSKRGGCNCTTLDVEQTEPAG